jgi:predicted dehydrogenase
MVGALREAAITRLPSVRLVAVSDVDRTRAATLAGRCDARIEPDWRCLIYRTDIDSVIVATPPPLHVEMCVEALTAGKHVLCEKPLAPTPDESRKILDAAIASGQVLATGFNYRFYPAIKEARVILDSGRIGELDHIRSYAGHPGGTEFTHPWVHDASVMGGGTLMDNGIHIIDLTQHFLGGVAEVKGFSSGDVWDFPGCEDNGFALLRSPAGKVATLQASWTEWRGYRFAIDIYGTRGCVRASYPPMLTMATWRDGRTGRLRRRIYAFPLFQVIERLRSFRWTVILSFTEELREFEKAVKGERTANALGWDGYMAVQIAHAVYHTSRNGCSVLLDGSRLPHPSLDED